MSVSEIFSIHYYHGYIMQLFVAELLFLPILQHKEKFWLRFLLSFVVYGFLSLVATNLLFRVIVGLSSITIFLFSLGMCAFCYQNKFKDILFCCVGAQLIQNLSHNIELLIYLPLKAHFNDLGWFFLSVGVMVVVYSFSYYFIIRRMKQNEEINVPSGGVFALAGASALFCYFVQYLFTFYKIDSYWITTLPLLYCDIFAIIFAFGLVSYRDKQEENLELERFISQSKNYYESVKNNIDLLNMKAHDLKHFISDTKEKTNMDDETLMELEKTVEDYESMIKTGNTALDYILTEKSYACKRANVPLTYTVDGEALAFMKSGDVTSLFGNLLSNAIEAEAKLANQDQAFILLKVSEFGQMVSVHVENYYPEKVAFKDGLPITTKKNAKVHGFGVKSIFYIAKKYYGEVSIQQENDVYEVNILFPKNETQNAKK